MTVVAQGPNFNGGVLLFKNRMGAKIVDFSQSLLHLL